MSSRATAALTADVAQSAHGLAHGLGSSSAHHDLAHGLGSSSAHHAELPTHFPPLPPVTRSHCIDLRDPRWCQARRKACGVTQTGNVTKTDFMRVSCNATCGCEPATQPTAKLLRAWLHGGPTYEHAVLASTIPPCADWLPRRAPNWPNATWHAAVEASLRAHAAGSALVIGANTGAVLN